MADFYLPVPFHSDRDLEPLDLILIGRTRSHHTGSLKSIYLGHWIEIGQSRKEREEKTLPARVSAILRRDCGQTSSSGDAPVDFRAREKDDEVRSDAGISMVWSSTSIASCTCVERRLERRRPGMCRGSRRPHWRGWQARGARFLWRLLAEVAGADGSFGFVSTWG
jgi:hypothetical protein